MSKEESKIQKSTSAKALNLSSNQVLSQKSSVFRYGSRSPVKYDLTKSMENKLEVIRNHEIGGDDLD